MSTGTYHKILAADDGSEEGERAADIALRLAAELKAEVILLAVKAPPNAHEIEGYAKYEDPAVFRRKMQERFWRLSQQGESSGVRVYCEIAKGNPAQEILKCADAQSVDLIVLGRRKMSTLLRIFAGSISESVMRDATCSVMIAR